MSRQVWQLVTAVMLGGLLLGVPLLANGTENAWRAGGVPTLDLSSLTESTATTEPMSENGLLGLLAAVSMVLVLGVSTGVIRAIVSQRAYRTKIA